MAPNDKDVFDDIGKIETQLLSSELPSEIVATVTSAFEDVKKGQYPGPVLKLILRLEDGTDTITVYNIPKAWTGKGQMDTLKASMEKLGLGLKDLVGKKFRWERQELTGPMKGNPRHYPVEVIEE